MGVNGTPIFQFILVSKDLLQDKGSTQSSSSILASIAEYIADVPDPIALSVVRAKHPDDQPEYPKDESENYPKMACL